MIKLEQKVLSDLTEKTHFPNQCAMYIIGQHTEYSQKKIWEK